MIAALYVADPGCYMNLPGVDPWPEPRDARLYDGPWPVVAHPPCARWGKYSRGGPSTPNRYTTGDDGGCFAATLAAVRRCGGVLEHPAGSKAWAKHGLKAPPKSGGWIRADDCGGWTCAVEQGHYGHQARKLTWLYAVATNRPALKWGPSCPDKAAKIDPGNRKQVRRGVVERLSKRQRLATPPEFRDLLIALAESAQGRMTSHGPVPHT